MKIKTLLLTAGILVTRLMTAYPQTYSFTTTAGGSQGFSDGVDAAAEFSNPTGVAVDSSGNVYVADQANNAIREITPQGTNWVVTTIAGGTQGSLDGMNTNAQFFGPTGITIDSSGNLYVADQFNSTIRMITPTGTNWVVSTIAGQAGVPGTNNGSYTNAHFADPTAVAVDASGDIFVADELNNDIRKISLSGTNWVVTTVAGGMQGDKDGTNDSARFYGPAGVAVDTNGNVFVSDQFNNAIRLITPSGTNWVVTTIAGQTVSGNADGTGTNAQFDSPVGVAADTNGNIFIADLFNSAIRKITPVDTNWVVSTIGGGTPGFSNAIGTNAQFYFPFGVAADDFGGVLVADSGNNAIRLGLSSAGAPQIGDLTVTITPTNAISAGAKWQFDGGADQESGTTLSNLAPGPHTITFTAATGFTTPANQTINVTAHQTTDATGNYTASIANAGSLQVGIYPPGAALAGAQWQVDNGPLETNNAIVAGLSLGDHTVVFSAIQGWTTPSNLTVVITNQQTTLAAGTYVLQTGALHVTLIPTNVVTAGAKWQIDGGSLHASGVTVTNVLPGSHTISFNTVLGWTTPPDQVISISNNATTTATAIYTQTGVGSGSLQVDILPAAAVEAGAQWQVDGGPLQTNGAILTNYPAGFHDLSFTSIPGYITPANQEVVITNGEAVTATGTYISQGAPTGSLQVNITPGGAVTNGAEWQVDGGAFETNGAILSGLTVGSHTLAFNVVPGYTTPSNIVVSITNNSTNVVIGTYIFQSGQSGALQVNISPQGAATNGAQWQVDGGPLQSSGLIVTGLTVGNHNVAFSVVPGYTTPPTIVVSVTSNSTNVVTGTYFFQSGQSGALQVNISPQGAATNGAQWQVDGGPLQGSGVIVPGLTVGNHTVSFSAVAGWITPPNQTIMITNQLTTVATGIYASQTGALLVTITPVNAVIAGAKWQVDGGALQVSDTTVSNLLPGNHTIVFYTAPKWIPPVDQTVTIVANQTTYATGVYKAGTDKTPPKVSITSGPAANAHVTTPIVTFDGKASDNIAVNQVLYQFNNSAFQPATGLTNWSVTLMLVPGTNIFSVKALDASDNASALMTRKFLFIVTNTLTVSTNGLGKITPVLNGSHLDVGVGYKLTATPGAGQLFSNWTGVYLGGTINSSNSVLNFLMQTNLALQANFVPNPFIPQIGVFNGLFYDTNGIELESSGFFTLTLSKTGSCSASVSMPGGPYKTTGQFSLDGQATLTVKRKGNTPLTINLQLDLTNPVSEQITGEISDGTWTAELLSDREVFSATTNKAVDFEGAYTMAIAGSDDPTIPFGVGCATLSVNSAGIINMVGSLADGTPINQNVSISKDGRWPFYMTLPSGGLVISWLTFSNQPASTLGGTLTWIRPPGPKPKIYTAGFTNQPAVIGSRYEVTNGSPVLTLNNGEVILEDGTLPIPLTNSVDISVKNALTVTPGEEKLTLKLSATTGLITGSFTHPVTKLKTSVNGVVLQNLNQAQGYFTSTNLSGLFLLQGN